MDNGVHIPASWETVELVRLCELINGDRGKNYPSKELRAATGIPFVNAGHIKRNDISDVGMTFVDEERYELLGSGKFRRGDILFCIRGSLGKVALNTRFERGAIASSLIIVRPHRLINTKFVLYFLASPLASRFIGEFDNGTAQPNLSGRDFARFLVPVPPRSEQDRIVEKLEELFSELDFSIACLSKARYQISLYRQAVLGDAFSGKLTTSWRRANPEAVLPANQMVSVIKAGRDEHYQRKASRNKKKQRALKVYKALSDESLRDLPSLPKEWVWEKLGWMTCGVEYGSAAKSADVGSVPVLRMGNIQNGKFDWSDLVYTSDPQEIAKYALRSGDVLFNRTNSPELVGKTAIYRGERSAVFAGYLIRINQIASIVDGSYLNLFLNSRLARRFGSFVKTDGVNQSNINGDKLSNYPFPYCSIAEQQEVVRILEQKLSVVDRMEEDVSRELLKAEALRKSILIRALSGGLVSQNPKDETASLLLMRMADATHECGRQAKKETKRNAA
jgi:type I restriction enzyme S subunit